MDNFPELGFGVPQEAAVYGGAVMPWLRRRGLILLALACLSLALIRIVGLPSGRGPIKLPAASAATLIPVDSTPASTQVTTSCQRASFSQPQQLDLSARPVGLTTVSDPIDYYAISGANDAVLRQQIISCAPQLSGQDQFTGYSVYALDWSYDYSIGDNNQCQITSAKVGLHLAEVLPQWQDGAASASFTASWQHFMTRLRVHENGHLSLDKQYAAKVLADLQHAGPLNCGNLTATVSKLVHADITALNQANDNYDAITDHGATQGAILP